MYTNIENYQTIKEFLTTKGVALIAVSKTKPAAAIQELYDLGQRDFGENYVQELVDKYEQLPKDIRWHFIGHLQSNKVKYIAPFVHLIHGVDSEKLLLEINKQGLKNKIKINCLLQMHIAQEETKFGMDANEIFEVCNTMYKTLENVTILGLMGMASFSDDENVIKTEFRDLNTVYDQLKMKDKHISTLSSGMSGDYKIAIENGSNMVRIGSLLFGSRS
jgi:PLP dependent protein